MDNPIQLRQIYFVITRRCNLFCSHCIRSSGPAIRDNLLLTDAVIALQKLAPYGKNAQLLLSGGEPTTYKSFIALCEAAVDLYPEVIINTNGLRYEPLAEAAKLAKNKVKVQISIDGDEITHNKIRGRGTFKSSLANVKRLFDQDIRVTVATTVGHSNVGSLYLLDEALQNLGFDAWTIQREVAYGRAMLSDTVLDTAFWNEFAKKSLLTFKNRSRIHVATMFDWAGLKKRALDPLADQKGTNCGTFSSKIYINPDLTTFPCGCLEQVNLGDLSKEETTTIMSRIQQYRSGIMHNAVCTACPFFAVCKGGCWGAAYNFFGQYGAGDPRCPAIHDLVVKQPAAELC